MVRRQSGEALLGVQEVPGSNPGGPTSLIKTSTPLSNTTLRGGQDVLGFIYSALSRNFDKKPISRGFAESHEFGLGDGHTLSLEE